MTAPPRQPLTVEAAAGEWRAFDTWDCPAALAFKAALIGQHFIGRLWLSDPLALYGVENAKMAPGYQAPSCPEKR